MTQPLQRQMMLPQQYLLWSCPDSNRKWETQDLGVHLTTEESQLLRTTPYFCCLLIGPFPSYINIINKNKLYYQIQPKSQQQTSNLWLSPNISSNQNGRGKNSCRWGQTLGAVPEGLLPQRHGEAALGRPGETAGTGREDGKMVNQLENGKRLGGSGRFNMV